VQDIKLHVRMSHWVVSGKALYNAAIITIETSFWTLHIHLYDFDQYESKRKAFNKIKMNPNSKSKNSLKSKHYEFDFVHNTISMLID